MRVPPADNAALRVFAKIVCFSTLFLIFAGSLVTSTGSGLAVPDWPLSYGMLFPPMVGGVFYEHGHRLIAGTVGFLTVVLAAWLYFKETRQWLRRLGLAALLAVIAQGVLGGVTVLFLLPTAVSVSHAVLGQTFFCITVVIAYGLSRERAARGAGEGDAALFKAALAFAGTVYVQLILGALMRHTHSGLALYDFPTMAGRWWPSLDAATLERVNDWRFDRDLDPVTTGQIFIHLLHRLGALLVTGAAVFATAKAWRRRRTQSAAFRTILLIDALLALQILFGGLVVWTLKEYRMTSLHVATGALLLGLGVLFSLRAAPIRSPAGVEENAQTAIFQEGAAA